MKIYRLQSEVLYLPLIKEWFDAIVYGDKRQEYRMINSFWLKRLYEPTNRNAALYWDSLFGKKVYENKYNLFLANVRTAIRHGDIRPKDYNYVEFTLGYPRKDDTERRKRYKIKEIIMGVGLSKWGAPDCEVFIIRFDGNESRGNGQ